MTMDHDWSNGVIKRGFLLKLVGTWQPHRSGECPRTMVRKSILTRPCKLVRQFVQCVCKYLPHKGGEEWCVGKMRRSCKLLGYICQMFAMLISEEGNDIPIDLQ
jgi:hypothetical protein